MSKINVSMNSEEYQLAMKLLDLYEKADMCYFNNYNHGGKITKEIALENALKADPIDEKTTQHENAEMKYITAENYDKKITVTFHYE